MRAGLLIGAQVAVQWRAEPQTSMPKFVDLRLDIFITVPDHFALQSPSIRMWTRTVKMQSTTLCLRLCKFEMLAAHIALVAPRYPVELV